MNSTFNWFGLIIVLLLIILYLGNSVSPLTSNLVWAFGFLIPFAIIANIVFLVIALIYKKAIILPFAILLIAGSNYVRSSFGFKFFLREKSPVTDSFTVLNHNVGSLHGLYRDTLSNLPPNPDAVKIRNWILTNDSDIQCYQEFINLPNDPEFDLTRAMRQKGFHIYFSKSKTEYEDHEVGILIASKFPIVEAGDVNTFKAKGQFHFNRILYADLKLQNDTVRIINFHLASMALRSHNPLTKGSMNSAIENGLVIIERLKQGIMTRSRQVEDLVQFIKTSPHPVVCVGDFNDLPYTYSYLQMKQIMDNTFEERGVGFGFTYNGSLLRTLRIDNQFYTEGILPIDFETLHEIDYSDHYPVRGRYRYKDR